LLSAIRDVDETWIPRRVDDWEGHLLISLVDAAVNVCFCLVVVVFMERLDLAVGHYVSNLYLRRGAVDGSL
jgi:hypothetical protein